MTPRGLLLLAAAVLVAWVGASFPTHGWPATALVLAPAGVLLGVGWRRPPSTVDSTVRVRRGVILWSVLLVMGLGWEAYAFVRQPDWSRASYDYPTLSTLLDPVLEHGPLRVVGWLVWLWAGWRLVSR